MKYSLAVIALAATLSACTTPPVDQRASTLNVDKDNRVGMKTAESWFWTNRTDQVLAVKVAGRAYSLKDVDSITWTEKDLVSIRLADGAELKTAPAEFRWLSCTSKKVCPTSAQFQGRTPQESLGGLLESMPIAALEDPSTITRRQNGPPTNPYYAIERNHYAIPAFTKTGDRVVVLKAGELAELDKRVASVMAEWNAKDRAARKRGMDEWENLGKK